MTQTKKGMRFSHLYVTDEETVEDSEKARFRLAKLMQSNFPASSFSGNRRTPDYKKSAITSIESELGIRFASKAQGGGYLERWDWFFKRINRFELLDSITILIRNQSGRYRPDTQSLIEKVNRILAEEKLPYEVDELGGVHPKIDSAFAVTKQSAISVLDGERYLATADLVEKIDPCLLQDPPDYTGAIRAIFGANENLFKMMFGVPRLDARTAADKLGKLQQSIYDGHPTQQRASAQALNGFKSWIDAAHHYRHEEGAQEPSQPKEELAVMLIHSGLGYVRWLAQLDRQT